MHLYPMFLCQTNASQVVWGRAWSNKIRPDTRSMALWLLSWYTLVNQHGWLEKGRWKKMHVSLKMVLLHCHGFICLPEAMLFFLTDWCFGILTHSSERVNPLSNDPFHRGILKKLQTIVHGCIWRNFGGMSWTGSLLEGPHKNSITLAHHKPPSVNWYHSPAATLPKTNIAPKNGGF